jgi:hypothetical protein
MKTYIVYANGNEVGYIKAGSHNAAEKKAIKKYGRDYPNQGISVAYTEL